MKPATLAGYLLLAAIIYAPWALGSVTPNTAAGLQIIVFISAALWIAALITDRRPPRIPPLALACIVLLLLQGWWMILNAHGRYETDHIIPTTSIFPRAPGAVDGPVCRAMMLQITAALAALLIAADLACNAIWRWRFIATIAATGFSIAAWGLLQKIGLVPALAHRQFAESVFATYDYHGNAGAFLNLIIPAVFALAVHRHRQGGIAALLICVAAAMINVSKAGAAIALITVFVLLGWKKQAAFMPATGKHPFVPLLVIAFIALTLAAGGAAWKRWNQLATFETDKNPRLIMLKVALPMTIDAGLFGNGPGSFKLIYPTSPHMIKALYPRWKVAPYELGHETSIYSYVHDDYVQYTMEWGWLGATLWAALIATAIVTGLRTYHQSPDPTAHLIIAVSLIALAAIFTHALVDWPLQVPSLQLYVAVYLAILLAQHHAFAIVTELKQ